MSNKNNRVKHLEKIVKVEVGGLQEDVRVLNEENSELRRLLDEQNDYIKTEVKTLRDILIEHYQYQKHLNLRITDETLTRRQNHNRLRAEIASLEPVPRNWIVRLLFK